MKTKLFAFVIIIILIVPQVFAQSKVKGDTKIGFGLLGGVNLQNLNGKDFWGEKLDNKLKFGFHGGLNANIPFAPDFYFQPGLLFTIKGAKADEAAITTTVNLDYLEMPLNLLYRPQLGDGHILLGFGPYVAYGIGGKVKTEGGSITSNLDVKFQNIVKQSDSGDFAYYRAFDAGANIFFGYEFYYGIFCKLNAQLGMLKVNPEYELLSNDKTSYKNTGFGLSVGYKF
jgi:hypothetical protein